MERFILETARTRGADPRDAVSRVFAKELAGECADALFLDASETRVLGICGPDRYMPVCIELINDEEVSRLLGEKCASILIKGGHEKDGIHWRIYRALCDSNGVHGMPEIVDAEDSIYKAVDRAVGRLAASPGILNEDGELILDLKSQKVGLHYPINLLLGDRAGYAHPLITTPKSSVDALGRGSFRAAGGDQVLATRYVLEPEENGEPANRQFYLFEDGKQTFWSADINENVESAECCHSQNRTIIKYTTEDGLEITCTIFILPHEDGMPHAVEAQRVTLKDLTGKRRSLRMVATGVFGIQGPAPIMQDVVYSNIVSEAAVLKADGKAVCLSQNAKPADQRLKKRFAMILSGGEAMEEFCTGQSEFIGTGSLAKPEHALHLPCTLQRKMSSFFAMAKALEVPAGGSVTADILCGLCYAGDPENASDPAAADKAFLADPETAAADQREAEERIYRLYSKYRDSEQLGKVLAGMKCAWDKYSSYLIPETGDQLMDTYVRSNLPFQVLYQTYVSRAFAWTQKAYRETGFREIQDIYASMYYMCACGQNALVRELISTWITNVWEMGYANHNFTFRGKEPGDCSDDQLWLIQAVYRYVKLTGDTDFLRQEFSIEGTGGRKRPLWDTIRAILLYSGKISIGKHGLPLLDKADWNDTLRLDNGVMQGPAKEKLYLEQLAASGKEYGTPLENDLSESIMNAFLLKIAADETAELADMLGDGEARNFAESMASDIAERCREHAWKGDYYARCLINDGRKFTYLGAGGDGLSSDPDLAGSYFLNSYSWAILAGVATEEQIRIMLDKVNSCLRTDAGLKLCTLIAYEKLGVNTGTAFYFPGDRENCGVFKHAAMMASVASMKAAKTVNDADLADDLRELAFFMMDKTMPYKTMDDPFVFKGNPRFCTQYNNSETGENIGPMLSGTASWLTLGVYEHFGIDVRKDTIRFDPLLRPGAGSLKYTLDLGDAVLHIDITGTNGRYRMRHDSELSARRVDGTGDIPEVTMLGNGIVMQRPHSGEWSISISL